MSHYFEWVTQLLSWFLCLLWPPLILIPDSMDAVMCLNPQVYGFLFRWASYWMAQAFSGSICCSFFHILCHFGPCTSLFHVHYLLMAVHHLGAIHRLYEYGICVIEIRLASLGLSKGKPTPVKRVQMCDCVILVGFFHSPLLPFPIIIKA